LLSVHSEIAENFFELSDAHAFHERVLKNEELIAVLKKIGTGVSRSEEKLNGLNELAKAIKHSLEVTPIHPTEEYDKIIGYMTQDFVNRSRLSVMIWGPSEQGNEELFKKRVQIRDKLRDLGHQADFSEDILTPDALFAGGINLSVAELLMARGYEYIICIMGSPGSVGEVHDFCHMPEIAHKMTICVNEEHLSGYSGRGVLEIFEGNHGRIEKFKFPQDITDCHLLRCVVDQIDKCVAAKQDQIARSAGEFI
jgi:hypothetical protein